MIIINYILAFIPASNEPSSRARADIWRMPRGQMPFGARLTREARPCRQLCRGAFGWKVKFRSGIIKLELNRGGSKAVSNG